MPELYIPKYIVQMENEEKKQDPIRKSEYQRCTECKQYVLTKAMERHRLIWCDPENKRRKNATVRSSATAPILGNYVLGHGVNPRPITDPPKQECPFWCSRCMFEGKTFAEWRSHHCGGIML